MLVFEIKRNQKGLYTVIVDRIQVADDLTMEEVAERLEEREKNKKTR